MAQRERLTAIVIGGLLLAGALWLIFNFNWSQQGGQYRELGQSLAERGGVRASDYAYVANSRTKLYWPNREPYISQIPAANRVYILDAATLRSFKGYRPGPR